jgi:hypothetical protein
VTAFYSRAERRTRQPISASELEHPSFSTFKTRLSQNHYSLYLDFLSTAGSDHDAEMWFDHELKQTWRRKSMSLTESTPSPMMLPQSTSASRSSET